MNAKGIPTRRGKEWSAGSVQVILRNNFYAGVLTHQGKEIKGNHEPLISKVQFGKVQAQISKRKRRQAHNKEPRQSEQKRPVNLIIKA